MDYGKQCGLRIRGLVLCGRVSILALASIIVRLII